MLEKVDPSALSASDLVDAVITAERMLAHVNALQTCLLAELGRPNRCGDVTELVAALVDKAGAGRGTDGAVDPAVVAELTADRSIGLAATEVAAVLDWSPITARIRISQSMRLQSALPKTLDALQQGRVDVGRVRMIVDRTAVLSPKLCGQVEGRILKCVKGRSKGQLETLVDREVILADPEAAENRRLAAVKGRSVTHRVDKDGMGVINALLPAEAAVMVFTLVDLIAEANKGLDGRTADQRRADAIADIADELLTHGFVDLHGLIAKLERATAGSPEGNVAEGNVAEGNTRATNESGAQTSDHERNPDGPEAEDAASEVVTPEGPAATPAADTSATEPVDRAVRLSRAMSRHGRRPHLNATGAWSTIVGLDDLPGHLHGHGVITAQLLRAISKSWGSLTAVGVNPVTGTATAIGATTYRPTQTLRDQVMLLSGTCRMAGCRMPAWKCDIDHVDPFDHDDPAAGGQTTLCNTLPYCKFHHLLKHHTDWTPHLQPDLSILWTTNTGHRAVSHPRQFTLPGEWHRCPPDDPGDKTALDPAASWAGAEFGTEPAITDWSVNAYATMPDPAMIIGPTVTGPTVTGPTVTGPTIPVVPAGTEWIEPNTELEDPDAIAHPGSVEIHSYRILRQQSREHSLRRLAGLRQHFDPAEQRKRDFINGRTLDADGNPLDPADFDDATREEARMVESLAMAALVERSRTPSSSVDQSTSGRLHTQTTPREAPSDEAPF